MSKRLLIFLVVLSLVLVPVSTIAATNKGPNTAASYSVPGPAGTFGSAFTIQNLSTVIANCSYQFFNTSGTAVYTSAQFTVAVSGSNFTYVPNISALASGQYSGVVSCDQEVAAVVNSASANSAGSYGGILDTATTWYLPIAQDNYYNFYTNLVVQNASTSPVNVTVDIIGPTGAIVKTQTANNVAVNGFANFEQAGLTELSNNVAYSAKVTGTGPIAVEANSYGQGSVANQLYSYRPFTGGSTTAFAPVIMNNYYGNLTALTVQNMGTTTTDITVTYGTGLVQTKSLAGGAAYVFYTPNAGLPSGTLTSATIVSTPEPIVALINIANNFGRAASYGGFATGSVNVVAPIVLKRYYNYNTSTTCQNVGGSSTNMTITYSNGATTTKNNIAANGTALFYQPNETGLANGYNGSAKIHSSSQPIVCVTNQDQNEGSLGTTIFDMLTSYEGIPAP